MKNEFLKFPSKRILFSAFFVSAALLGESVLPLRADVAEIRSVMQKTKVSGVVLDPNGEPVIGATVMEKARPTDRLPIWTANFH